MLLAGCAPTGLSESARSDTGAAADALTLRWVPVGDEPWEEALQGLWWSLAGLGASPGPDAVEVVERSGRTVTYRLDPVALGLREPALHALLGALDPLEAARQAQGMPWIDTGRLLQRTLYEPWVYYAVTGACETVAGPSRRLGATAEVSGITDSLLTEGDRRIRFRPEVGRVEDIVWLAEGVEGTLLDGDFEPHGTETVDVMPNGRFRYAAYDGDGLLVPVADVVHTPAGQPGRCMWCHENHLMTGVVQPDVPGMAPYSRFLEAVNVQQARVEVLRASLPGPVDWDTHAVHTWSEVLVEGFLSPPTSRLSDEWGLPAETVEAWMSEAGITPERNEEYPDWGPVWRRSDADAVLQQRRADLDASSPLAGTTGAPLPVLPSARTLDAPSEAFFVAPEPYACGRTAAPAPGAE